MPRSAKIGSLALVLLLATSTAGCEDPPSGPRLSRAAERGRGVYLDNCATCHHRNNPHQSGKQGPPVARSSRQLLEAKVLRGQYPHGYSPKRITRTMPLAPHLAARIPDLAAFLAEIAPLP